MSRLSSNNLMGALLIISLMVFVVGLFTTASALLRGNWMLAMGSLGVTSLLGILAGILRLWMRAAAIAGQPSQGHEPSLIEALEASKAGELNDWIGQMAPTGRRRLLVSRLGEEMLARGALSIATAIGMTQYIAERAARQGIMAHVHGALKEQRDNPLWSHAFIGDELCATLLETAPEGEADLTMQLHYFVADTKPEHLVPLLAATLPEDLLAGSIVAYAEPEQLIDLLEQARVN